MPCHATLVWAVCCTYIHTLVLRNKQSMSCGITTPSSTHRHETPQVLSLCPEAQPLGPVALIADMALFPLLFDACRIPRKLSKSLATSRSQCDTILDCFHFFSPPLCPSPVCVCRVRGFLLKLSRSCLLHMAKRTTTLEAPHYYVVSRPLSPLKKRLPRSASPIRGSSAHDWLLARIT